MRLFPSAQGGTVRRSGEQGLALPLFTRWRWIAFPTILFICTRCSLLLLSQIALTLVPNLWLEYRALPLLQHYPALDGLCRYDCGHFARIAREGYSNPGATNFFPLFPLLVRLLHDVSGIPLEFTLLIVPNLAGFAALLVIYRIFLQLSDEAVARTGLVLFAAYPFAFFQATGYPESLMIFFSALAILLALRGNHIWAGAALGLGVLARHLTIFAGAALVVAQIRQRGFHPRRLLGNLAILGLLVPWLFVALYCLYQYERFGDPLAFWVARANWGPRAWWGIQNLLKTTDRSVDVRVMYSYIPFALVPSIGAVALLRRPKWHELAAFAVVLMAILWGVGVWGLGRYSASCWPAFLPLGAWLSKRANFQGPIVAILAVFQGLFFYLFVHQFPIL